MPPRKKRKEAPDPNHNVEEAPADGESSNKKQRPSNSSAYDEFEASPKDKKKVRCLHCPSSKPSDIVKSAHGCNTHLKTHHPQIYELVKNKEAQSIEKRNKSKGSRGSSDDKRELAKMIFGTGSPVSLIRHPRFRSFVTYCKEDFQHTTIETLWDVGEDMVVEMKTEMMEDMAKATSISLSIDGWTVTHQTSSHLGVTAQLFSMIHKELVNYKLALKKIEGKHSGKKIAKMLISICQSYGILMKVTSIAADNAGNMSTCIKALNDECDKLGDVSEQLGGLPPVVNAEDPTVGDGPFVPLSCDLRVLGDGDKSDCEEEEDAEEITAADTSYDELKEISNFLQQPLDVNLDEIVEHFNTLRRVHRVNCYSHSKQLAIKHSCKKGTYFYKLLRKVRAICVKFSRSEGPKNELKSAGSLCLLRTVATRWWSDYLATERLDIICENHLDLVNSILEKYKTKKKSSKKDTLSVEEPLESEDEDESRKEDSLELKIDSEDRKMMKQYLEIMKPFMIKSDTLGADSGTTHLVVPAIREIQEHLEVQTNENLHNSEVLSFLKTLRENFDKYFKFAVQLDDQEFNPIFLASTMLAPIYSVSLDENEKAVAKEYIKKLYKERKEEEAVNNDDNLGGNLPVVGGGGGNLPGGGNEPVVTGFPGLSKKLASRRKKQDLDQMFEQEMLQYSNLASVEIDRFLSNSKRSKDPIPFWAPHCDTVLGKVALGLLTIYPTSVSCERLFSISSLMSSLRRNRITAEHLETRVLLKCNVFDKE